MKATKLISIIINIIISLALISTLCPTINATSKIKYYEIQTDIIPDKVTSYKDVPTYNIADESYYGYIKQGTSCELYSWRNTPAGIQYIIEYPDGTIIAANKGDFINTCYYNTISNNANIIYDYLLNSNYSSVTYTETIFTGYKDTEFESFVKVFNYRYYNMKDCGVENRVMGKPALVYTKTENNTYKIDLAASRKNLNLEQNILNSLNLEDKSDFEKVVAIEKYIAKNMNYDYDLSKKMDYSTDKVCNGPFTCLEIGKGICADFASTYYYLANAAGIKTYLVTGFAGERHSWNCSYINGKWYYIDVCFYDSNNNSIYLGSDKPFANRTIESYFG